VKIPIRKKKTLRNPGETGGGGGGKREKGTNHPGEHPLPLFLSHISPLGGDLEHLLGIEKVYQSLSQQSDKKREGKAESKGGSEDIGLGSQ